MFKNVGYQLIVQSKRVDLVKTRPQCLNHVSRYPKLANSANEFSKNFTRSLASSNLKDEKEKLDIEEEKKELVVAKPAEIFEKAFPDYYENGKFVTRISYVEFIDEALARLDELGLNRDLNAYKELMRVFPKGKYFPEKWEIGPVHAPQQMAAQRIIRKMEMNRLKPDKEFNRIVVSIFSKKSEVSNYLATFNYWSMKGRNLDPNPLPEEIPDDPREMASIALARMNPDPITEVMKAHTSELADSIDKTWVVYSTSRTQKALMQKLEPKSTLYLERAGFAFVDAKYLNFFTIKVKTDPETAKIKSKAREPDPLGVDYNRLKVKFYGAPVKEKLQSLEDRYFIDDGYLLGVGITGTSSQDSALSWFKLMQRANPNLSSMNIVFRFPKQIPELVNPSAYPNDESKRHGSKEQEHTSQGQPSSPS